MIFLLLILITVNISYGRDIYLGDMGIINDQYDYDSSKHNGCVFYDALDTANGGDSIYLRENETIYYVPCYEYIENLYMLDIVINGELILYNETGSWEINNDGRYFNAIDIRNSKNMVIRGTGKVNGYGYIWWKEFKKNDIVRFRPTLINLENTINITIHGIYLENSPRFNIYIDNGLDIEIYNITIWINFLENKKLVFPYNTDGIDFSGVNGYFHNITINNYDDSIAIKPNNMYSKELDGINMECTKNVLIEDITIFKGVGLSIGSITQKGMNCIKNIVFKNIKLENPIKIIYIKSEQHENDSDLFGHVSNISYINIESKESLLWPIYIGPQQQKEPDGTGNGIWPNVNPLVNISDIYVENVTVNNIKTLLGGILRCNETNPCRNIHFKNTKLKNKKEYYCENVNNIFYDKKTIPKPLC